MRTLRLIRRLLSEGPLPARRYLLLLWGSFLSGFVLGAATGVFWIALIGAGVAGIFAFLFGRCVHRDINNAATFWSAAYKESRGMSAGQFTFFDVPTVKSMGVFYMLIGVFWTGGALFALLRETIA